MGGGVQAYLQRARRLLKAALIRQLGPKKTLLNCPVAARLNTRRRVKRRHFVFTTDFYHPVYHY